MKKSIVFFLVGICFSVQAQRVKYKDLFPTLAELSASEQLSALRDYITYDLDHPNANFRLALLHERSYRAADPLTNFQSVMAHAQEAGVRYIKAKQLVNESEVRGNNEYYAPVFGQLDAKGKLFAPFALVQGKMQRGYDSAMLIQQKLPAIYTTFTKSVNQYDKAVKLFASISTTYKSEEDIYMFYSVEFETQMDQLTSFYDSSVFYFRQYQTLTAEFPLAKYKQQAVTKEIKTYRLDGLINKMSFLENNVIFWNYRQWTERIRATYQAEILTMQSQLNTNEKRLSESIRLLASGATSDLAKVDKELIYKLNNYDKNSLALALLRYKSFKQDWLIKEKAVTTDTTLKQKLELYSVLIQQNRMADSLYRDVKSSITADNVLKHKKFLTENYNGSAGLDIYAKEESAKIETTLSDYQSKLKQDLLTSVQKQESIINKFVKIGAASIPLFTIDSIPSTLDNITWVTQQKLSSPDGSIYLLGVGKPDKKNNNLHAFIAKVNPDGKAAWMQDYSFSVDSAAVDANNSIRAAVLTQEGCAFVVMSKHMTRPDMVNTFLYLTEKKEEKLKKRLKENSFLRDLLYVEESNSFVLSFKGAEVNQNFVNEETLSVQTINVLGDLVWRRDITLAGSIEKLLQVRDGFIIAGNFTLLRDQAGKEIRTRVAVGQTNPYLIKLGGRGDVQKVLPLISAKSIYLDEVVKVNDGSINLLTYEHSFTEPKTYALTTEILKHTMVNYELKVILSTL